MAHCMSDGTFFVSICGTADRWVRGECVAGERDGIKVEDGYGAAILRSLHC